jgi:hypothetical protein
MVGEDRHGGCRNLVETVSTEEPGVVQQQPRGEKMVDRCASGSRGE